MDRQRRWTVLAILTTVAMTGCTSTSSTASGPPSPLPASDRASTSMSSTSMSFTSMSSTDAALPTVSSGVVVSATPSSAGPPTIESGADARSDRAALVVGVPRYLPGDHDPALSDGDPVHAVLWNQVFETLTGYRAPTRHRARPWPSR